MEIKDPNNKFEDLRLKTEQDLKNKYPNKDIKVIYKGEERSFEEQEAAFKKGSSTTKFGMHNIGAARDFNIIIDGRVLGNSEKDHKIYRDFLWKNAEETGLFHLNGEQFGKTDPYHIGLVEEKGDGTAYKRLLENYPEIKDSSYYKDTYDKVLEKKKKNPSDTTYDAFINANLDFKPKEDTETKTKVDPYGLSRQNINPFPELKQPIAENRPVKDLYGVDNQVNEARVVPPIENKQSNDPYGLTRQTFDESTKAQDNNVIPENTPQVSQNKTAIDPYGLTKQISDVDQAAKELPKLDEIPKDKVDYDMFANLKIVPLEELRNSPNITRPTNIGDAQIGNTDFGESKYDKTYSPNLYDVDNGNYKYERGEQQNGFAQLGLGVLRAVSKAGVEFAKTPAYLYSLGEWGARNIAGEDYGLDKALDNAVLNGLESLDQSIKESLPVYQSYKSGKGGILDAIGSTAFWASDGADGVGYLLGMMGPGFLLKGVNMASKISKLGIGVQAAEGIELGTQTMLNTFVESAAEAKGVADRLKASGASDEEIAKSAKETFFANMAVLVGPNLIMNKALLGSKTAGSILDKFKDATGKYTTQAARNGLKEYAGKAAIGIGSEGFWEEGSQTSIENYEVNRGLGLTKDGFLDGVAKEYINTLNTTEGQKSILLGAVLGGLGNMVGAYRENKQIDNLTPTITKLIETNFDGFAAKNDPFKRHKDHTLELDENGKPEYDILNMIKAIHNMAGEYKDSQVGDMALMSDNKALHDYITHNELARQFVPFYELGDAGLELLNDKIESIRSSEFFKQDEFLNKDNKNKYNINTHIAELKTKAKELQDVYNKSQEVMQKLDADIFSKFEVPEGKEETFEDYKNQLLNKVFFEASKQVFYKDKIKDLNRELSKYTSAIFNEDPQDKILTEKLIKEVNDLHGLLKNSHDLYNTILDPKQHKDAFENYVKEEETTNKAAEEAKEKATRDNASNNTREHNIFKEMLDAAMNAGNIETFDSIYSKLKDHVDLTSEQREQLIAKRQELDATSKPATSVEEIQQVSGLENTKPDLEEDADPRIADIERRRREEIQKLLSKVDTTNNYVVMHQTDKHGADNINKIGFTIDSGLNGTVSWASKESIERAINDIIDGRGHRGSSQLVVMSFPKSNYKSEVRQIDSLTDDMIDSNMTNIPLENITFTFDNAKYNAEIAALSETTPEDQEEVSKALKEDTIDNTREVEQSYLNDNRVSELYINGKYFNIANNVVMMRLFDHKFIDINGRKVFLFEKNENGLPQEHNRSNINIDALNKIKVGDTISFHLVDLDEENSKDFVNPPDFDGKHIAIKFGEELIGFVQQPHPVDPDAKFPEISESKRNELIAFRKALIAKLATGPVTEQVTTKSTGNLYSKTNNKGSIEAATNVMNDYRDKDSVNNLLVFVYADKDGKLQLKQGDLTDKQFKIIEKQYSKYKGIKFKSGKLFQMVKDIAGGWSIIPVYSNLVDDYTADLIIDKLSEYDNTTNTNDISRELDNYIYSSSSRERANLYITAKDGVITFKTNSQEFKLDDIKADSKEFKKALKSNRQNIQVDNIHNESQQEDLRERNALVTNVTQFIQDGKEEGEYFVQPYIEYSYKTLYNKEPLNVTTIEANTETDQKGTDKADTDVQSKLEKLKALRAKKGDSQLNEDSVSSTSRDNTTFDEKQFIAWLKANLPQLKLADKEAIASLKANLVDTFGIYKDLTIYLFSGAGNKTAYHEAFHGVFRNLLSYDEKIAVLKAAIEKYGVPTPEELVALQSSNNDYLKYSVKQMKYLWYEEKLADAHGEFADRYNDRNFLQKLGDVIANLFNKILKLFNLISDNPNTIDTLFKNINTGVYKNAKTVKSINDLEIFNREFGHLVDDIAYSRELKGIFKSPTIEMKTIQSISNRFIALYQDKVNSGIRVSDEEARSIFGSIYQQYDKAANDIIENDHLYTVAEFDTIMAIIENWSILVKESVKYASERKMNISKTIFDAPNVILNVDENTNEVNDEDGSTEGSEGPEGFNKGLADAVSIEGLSSASTRLKMFLSSVPILKNGTISKDSFGIEQYHDFTSLYYYIEQELTGVYTLTEQILLLDKLSESRPELKQIIAKLGYEVYNDDNISEMEDQRNLREVPVGNVTQDRLDLLRSDFKTNFSKQHLAYTLIKFVIDKASGATKYEIIDANRNALGIEIFNSWVDNLSDPARDTIASMVDGKVVTNGTKKGLDAKNDLDKLFESKINVKDLNKILLKFGLEYSKETLEVIVNNPTKLDEFKNQLNTYVDYLVGENAEQKEKNARMALRSLVDFETTTVLTSYTSSFNDAENKNIYTIQLPSFASRRIALIKAESKKFKSWLNEMKQDPYYKYSNLLDELNTNSPYRNDQFKMSMLDGLKDKYSDNGKNSKFTSLSPKDYMISQIALYQNKAANQKVGDSQGKMRGSEIFKHIYITPSDKTLAMIFDMVKYQVILEKDVAGHFFIRRESTIIKKFYKAFLQEAARIKHNVDIKNDILNNKGQGKYKLIDLKQYLHFDKASWSEVSKFMNTNPKDITDEEWEIVKKGLSTGQAFKFIRFAEHKNGLNAKVLPELLDRFDDLQANDLEKFLENTIINVYGKEKSLKTIAVDIINDELNDEMADTVRELSDKGIIKPGKDKMYDNVFLDIPNSNPEQVHYDIFKLAAEFSTNTLLANTELSDLLNGDPAGYKPGDIQKRTYQSQSMVTNNNFTRNKAKAIVVKDHYVKSDNIDAIVDTMKKELGISDKEISDLGLAAYDDINVTDAQVHITPKFYEEVLRARGTWNDNIADAFAIAEGKKVGNIPDSLRMILAGIKPFIYGAQFDAKLGFWTHQQIKCAVLPIFKVYADINPLLAEKRTLMESKGVDILAYESSFKASIGYRDNVENNNDYSVDVNLDDFGIQVDNPVHGTDEENNSMRQMKMLLLGSIDPNKTYRGVSGRDIINNILSMEAENVDESLEQLSKKLDSKNNTNFSQFIKEMVTKRNATTNIEDSLEIVNNEFKYALDNGILSTQIENLFSSMYTNNVIKQSFAGDARVQATSLGFKFRNLKEQQANLTKEQLLLQQELQWIKPTKDGVEYAECCMPAWAKQFFDEDGFVKDIESIPANLREMIVYRIPTEGLHSMLPIRVVKFLPETMGNFILLPYEVTAQMGADFDFDKLFFIRKEFYMTEDGYNEYNFIDGEEKENIDQRWLQYVKYTNYEEQVDKSTFKTWSINRQNVKAARNNKIIDNYLTLLTAKENLKLLIKPSGFEKMKGIKKLFPQPSRSNFFSSRVQRDYKDRNHTGIALKGQSALHVSGHSYATLMDLTTYSEVDGLADYTKAVFFNGKPMFNFSGLYTQDGSLIADELSSIMAAILDDIKDPILATLGINKNTIDILGTIIRSGHNTETAIKFVSQLGVKELSKRLDKNTSKLKERNQGWETIDALIEEYKEALIKAMENVDVSKLDMNDKYHKIIGGYDELYQDINEKDLDYYIDKKTGFHDMKDVKKANSKEKAMFYASQIKVLTSFKNISEIAKPLTEINKFFAINKEVGPNMEDILAKQELYDKINQSKMIRGFDITKIPTLDSTWKVHKHAVEFFSKYFPYGTDYYMSIKRLAYKLQSTKTLDQVKVEDRQYINNFIRYFNDTSYGFFDQTPLEYGNLFVSLPNLVNEIKEFGNGEKKLGNTTYESIRNNLFFKNLKVTYKKEDPKTKFVKLAGNRYNLQVKNNMIMAFDILYKTPGTKKLATDLIRHSFVSGGFFTGLNSFASYISPEIMEDLGYMANRKNQHDVVKNTVLPYDLQFEMIRQLVRNNRKSFVKVFDSSMFGLEADTALPEVIVTTNDLVDQAKRKNDFTTDDENIPPMWISVFDKTVSKVILYEWNQVPGEFYTYGRIEELGIAGNAIEIDPTNRRNSSYFKVNKHNVEKTADESNTNEQPASPMIEQQLQGISSEEATQILDQNQPSLDEQDKNNLLNQDPDEPGPIENKCE